ncbi:MAG: MarR family transcriptional regulator [Actinomyces succiniciruminis]|uniref:MarR protein n=1 Tax=Actinomyces succiniciruminis TaxID=1522002 RepID=A0A1L7RPF9_9ACTO|nr:MarR family transcriptional regulator [Actinomyces succiniciruminis]MBE6473999.1 MarR family transcriptional regulator [Actinomyces succiniciruminis]CED91013.1 MarR protein [Actinomyces succiniciruminis]
MDDIRTNLHERLRRFQWLSRRDHASRRAAHGRFADTSRGQGRVLAALRLSSPIPTRDLAFLLGVRQQSLNELLKKLEVDGLVERVPSEEDRRIMVVRLTDAGRDAEIGSRDEEDILAGLDDEEVVAFTATLDKLIAALETKLGVDADEDAEERMRGARKRLGEERFEKMMRMREQGFGPGFGPAPFEEPGRGRRGGRRDHGGHHGAPARPSAEELTESEERRFRRSARTYGREAHGGRAGGRSHRQGRGRR